MVQVGELDIGEAEFAAETHAEQATAQRVAGHRALGEVESKGKRRNDFGERRSTGIHRSRFNDGDFLVGSSHYMPPYAERSAG